MVLLKLKLKYYGGGKLYSHSIIYEQKKLDTVSICRSTLCVNNDVENSMKFRVNPLGKDSSKQLQKS